MRIMIFGSPTTNAIKSLNLDGFFAGAGWVETIVDVVSKRENVELAFAFFYNTKGILKKKVNNCNYYCLKDYNFAKAKINKSVKNEIKYVIDDFKPDIVHVIGTERPHAKFILEYVGQDKFVASITGAISIISNLYLGSIKRNDLKKRTIGDFLRNRGVLQQQNQYRKKSNAEKYVIQNSKYIIGRSEFDYSFAKSLNLSLNYFYVNESLRQAFYDNENTWKLEQAQKNNILITQANYPIKGLHCLLYAVSLAKREIPDITITITGPDISKKKGLLNRLRFSTYGKYIDKLIKMYSLSSCVKFVGNVSASQMVLLYQNANVVVVPSIIENKSNTVGEAMIIGTPVICSYVGGMTEMVNNGANGFAYPFNEPERLAFYLVKLLNDPKTQLLFSQKSISVSKTLFSKIEMEKHLFDVYNAIIKNGK